MMDRGCLSVGFDGSCGALGRALQAVSRCFGVGGM